MNLEKDLERGSRAEKLLNDPMLTEAFELVAKAIHESWELAPIRDRDAAHELKLQMHILRSVRGNLEAALQDGKLAAEEVRRLNRPLSPAEWRANTRR